MKVGKGGTLHKYSETDSLYFGLIIIVALIGEWVFYHSIDNVTQFYGLLTSSSD